jgi:excinuclease ABC subunit A
LKADKSIRQRLVDSLEIAFHENPSADILTADDKPQTLNSPSDSSANTTAPFTKNPNRAFQFHSPFGACPTCQGFGNSIDIDFDLIVPNQMISLKEGAIAPFQRPQYDWAQKS